LLTTQIQKPDTTLPVAFLILISLSALFIDSSKGTGESGGDLE
jgi:hypothetical protein